MRNVAETRASGTDERWFLRVGGICAIVLGIAYVVTLPLYASVGAPPSTGDAWLRYLTGKTTVWSIIAGLSVLTDLLFVPVALALFLALRGAGETVMRLATAFVGLFVVLDLAVTWTNYASLITLGLSYGTATTDSQRAALVAAAGYPASVLASGVEPVYAIAILSLGILLIGLVMRRSAFGNVAAILALVTGVLGLVAPTRVGVVIILNAVCATAWILLVGYRLLRLGSQNRPRPV